MSDDDDSGGGGVLGIVIFLAIFAVINLALYFTTGWVIIPIKK